jgi:hypothetical protein
MPTPTLYIGFVFGIRPASRKLNNISLSSSPSNRARKSPSSKRCPVVGARMIRRVPSFGRILSHGRGLTIPIGDAFAGDFDALRRLAQHSHTPFWHSDPSLAPRHSWGNLRRRLRRSRGNPRCRRFETGGSLGRRVKCRRVPQPRWVGARPSAKGGKGGRRRA